MEGKQELYSTPEAAKELGISAGHMRHMIIKGLAHPKQRIGNSWLFTGTEIERLRTRKRTRGPDKKK